MDAFLASQRERFACGTCGELICVHYGKCRKCTPK
jgi:ribosomal protein S27AE